MYGDPRPLFLVVAIVIAGLVLWVGYVLLRMREPWRRNTALAVDPATAAIQAASPEKPTDEKLAEEKAESASDEKVADERQLVKPKND